MTVYRDTGDTAPALTAQLLVNGSPISLASASVVAIIGGTCGSGAAATYQRWVLPATWTAASIADASVTISLNPSGMAPASGWPCASPGAFGLELRAVSANGDVTQWPGRAPIPFIVRTKL